MTMRPKPTVRIENWFIVAGRIYGKIYGHPLFPDGEEVTTSHLVNKEQICETGQTVETKNTFYKLGDKRKPTKEEKQRA